MAVDKSKIEKQAREILDKFAKALEKTEKEHEVEAGVERDEFERAEGKIKEQDSEFRKRFLENASSHDNDFIISEKGEWKNGKS